MTIVLAWWLPYSFSDRKVPSSNPPLLVTRMCKENCSSRGAIYPPQSMNGFSSSTFFPTETGRVDKVERVSPRAEASQSEVLFCLLKLDSIQDGAIIGFKTSKT
ncbi:hypothetical protein TNCV_898921 [Trichonephila clavipes]|nr:hypothetical protein TNCV_898921 [Trichonephila clavipes]